MAKKKVAKASPKKAFKKAAEPKQNTFAQSLKKAVKKLGMTEETWANEVKTVPYCRSKTDRINFYVKQKADELLEALLTNFGERTSPLYSMENYAAAVQAVIEDQPWAASGADHVLTMRPALIARDAREFIWPNSTTYGSNDRSRLPVDELGIATLAEAVDKLRELLSEADDILGNLDEDAEEDDQERSWDSIERYEEEDGSWSSELKALDLVFADSNFQDFRSNVEGLRDHASQLFFTLGPDTPIQAVEVLAKLAPPPKAR